MKRGVAIAIGASAIFHVSVLLVLDAVEPPPRPPPPSRMKLGLAALPPSISIDVSIVPVTPAPAAAVPAPPPPPQVPPLPTSRPPTTPAAIAPSSAAAPTAAAVEPPAPPGMLSMRGRDLGRDLAPDRSGTSLPGAGVPARRGALAALGLGSLRGPEDFAYDPDGPQAYEAPSSGELHPTGGGTHRTNRPGFTGRVAADGSIDMEDSEAFDAEWRLPNPKKLAKRVARGMEDWSRDPHRQVRQAEVDKSTCHKGGGDGTNNCLAKGDYGDGGPAIEGAAKYAAGFEPDGEADDTVTIPIVGGRTELTDYVMRAVGQDPYLSDKLRWMDATREERVSIGLTHRRRQLDGADQIMRKHLIALWARRDLDLAAKREALFELWDDGAEDGDAAVVEAAKRTRSQVIGFIRARLPAGGAGAYTDAELQAFNRRRTSRARFDPY